MVQLNLLPDVKDKYLKALKLKRLVFGISFIVIGASIGLVLFMFAIIGAQQFRLDGQEDKIKELTSDIKSKPDLNKILTIQNQLNSLSELHQKKPVASRIYDFMPQITPVGVNINKLNVNFDAANSTMTITGTSKNQETTNKFVDTLKFTKYTVTGSEEQKNAFSEVVLTSFSISEKDSSYNITLKYSPDLFSSAYPEVKLIVPKQVSTRSTTERPEAIFITTENSEGQ